LKKRLAALDELRGKSYRNADADEREWRNLTNNILAHGFGENINNVRQLQDAHNAGMFYHSGMTEGQLQQRFLERLDSLAAVVKSSLHELELMGVSETVPSVRGAAVMKSDSRNVFLVHGHDDAMKESVARFLEKLDLHPIILHEQPNKGRTVIEKFEAHSDVGFAVVLLTPDDVGGLASSPDKPSPRARQNVILELGYFIGRLGRAKVCALHKGGVEIPSDIHGVLYVPYDAGNGWRLKLASEIKAAGIAVDLNLA
jgi:predicted nucleotide-binding protein